MITQIASALGIGSIYLGLFNLIAGSISLPLLTIILTSSLVMSKMNQGWGILHKGIK